MKPRYTSVAAWTQGAQGEGDWEVPTERYRLDYEIGRGGMGRVLGATDLWLRRKVALKRALDLDPDQVRRMMREAALTCALNHPAIPPIFDVGEDDDGAFYTMPVLQGRTLREALDEGLSLIEGVRVVLDVGLALSYAHDHGVVHRDVKPENILLGDHGEVWLLDWGVAWSAEEPDTDVVGTRGFMAPEQASGRCSPRSDVFALGRTLGCLLEKLPDLPLQAVVDRAAAQSPDDRYESAATLDGDLKRWLDGQHVHAHSYGPLELAAAWALRHARLIAVSCLVLGILGLSLLYTLQVQVRANGEVKQALARSLTLRAASFSRVGARAEAESLAVESLTMRDTPAARGQLVRWAGSPSAVHVGSGDIDCQGLMLETGGWYCPETRTLYDASGAARFVHTDEARWNDRSLSAALHGGLLLVDTPTRGYRAGGRVDFPETLHTNRHVLGDGSLPAFTSDTDLFVVDAEHGVASLAAQSVCAAQVNALYADPGRVVVGCRTGVTVLEGEERRSFAEGVDIAAVGWAGEVVVATHDGTLVFESTPALVLETGGRAAVQLRRLGDDRLVVLTESGRTRVLDVPSRTWLADLPQGADAITVMGARIRWFRGDRYHDLELPAELVSVELDLQAEGGVSALALHPDSRLAVGSATGAVHVWDLAKGAVGVATPQGSNVTKSVAWTAAGHLIASNGVVSDLEEDRVLLHAYVRGLNVRERGIDVVGFGKALRRMIGTEHVSMETPAVMVAWAPTAEATWIVDAGGGVYRLTDDLEAVFEHPNTEEITVHGDRVYLAESRRVIAYSDTGTPLWEHLHDHEISALGAGPDHLVIGDMRGRVSILSSDGELLAVFSAHERRVSAVVVAGSEVITGSWDGFVRRFGLEPLSRTPADLYRDRTEAWKLGLDRNDAAMVGVGLGSVRREVR